MESNNFSEFVNVVWQTSQALYLPIEAIALIALGMLAVFAMRRYKNTLASARTLKPQAAASLQQVVLSATLRSTAAVPQAAAQHAPTTSAAQQPATKRSPAQAVA